MATRHDDENEGLGLGGLLVVFLTAGALIGLHLATRKSPYERRIDETALLISQEAARLGKRIDEAHLELALRRFNEGQLAIFNRYVKAVIHRDAAAFEAMRKDWTERILPVINSAPEWKEYSGIILGS